MVRINRQSKAARNYQEMVFGSIYVVVLILVGYVALRGDPDDAALRQQADGRKKPQMVSLVDPNEKPAETQVLSQRMTQCPYTTMADLSNLERYPEAGSRHMIDPPKGGTVTLVCCQSTAGNMNIAVHHKWAPKGADGFVTMVKEGYFSSQVPLMRCIVGFLCQFGLSGSHELNKIYENRNLIDDPNWLPEGPTHKQNSAGVKRFAKGYMAYAGSGPNSRGTQLIVSLADVGPLAGGSPWEVPWGELVGAHSFKTLATFFTGYGEDGPPQALLIKEGASETVRAKWPLLDYITACEVLDQEIQVEK